MSPILDARFTRDRDGPCLKGVFRMSQYGRVFMTVWFTFLLIILPIFLVVGTATLISSGDLTNIGFLLAPIILVAFGFAFLRWGQSHWDADKKLIQQFVHRRFGDPSSSAT